MSEALRVFLVCDRCEAVSPPTSSTLVAPGGWRETTQTVEKKGSITIQTFWRCEECSE